MKAAVRRYAAGAEFHTEEGCFINELSNIADDPSVSIARARVAPGVTTQWHLIPPSCRQRIANLGPGDLVFLAICSPRFVTDVYEPLLNDGG